MAITQPKIEILGCDNTQAKSILESEEDFDYLLQLRKGEATAPGSPVFNNSSDFESKVMPLYGGCLGPKITTTPPSMHECQKGVKPSKPPGFDPPCSEFYELLFQEGKPLAPSDGEKGPAPPRKIYTPEREVFMIHAAEIQHFDDLD